MDRPTEAIQKLSECVSHDACDAERCEYFNSLEELQAVIAWVEELEAGMADPSEAEMSVTMKDGRTVYLKNIDSIMLLASKDYGTTYCGTFGKEDE